MKTALTIAGSDSSGGAGIQADIKTMTMNGVFAMSAVTAAVDIPVVAIGGISRDNILELAGCGLDGVAVVSALFAQPDVKAAAEEMLRLSRQISRP